jgi:hypothetical protein
VSEVETTGHTDCWISCFCERFWALKERVGAQNEQMGYRLRLNDPAASFELICTLPRPIARALGV